MKTSTVQINALLLGLLIGALLITTTIATVQNLSTKLTVGECVRELGETAIETVTAVTTGGAVETAYINRYTGNPNLIAYDSVGATKLVKVSCK